MKILPAVDMYGFPWPPANAPEWLTVNISHRGEYAKATVAAQRDLVAFIGTVLATVTVVRYARADVAKRVSLGRACSLWSADVCGVGDWPL
jgi:hypothetical protein